VIEYSSHDRISFQVFPMSMVLMTLANAFARVPQNVGESFRKDGLQRKAAFGPNGLAV